MKIFNGKLFYETKNLKVNIYSDGQETTTYIYSKSGDLQSESHRPLTLKSLPYLLEKIAKQDKLIKIETDDEIKPVIRKHRR